MPLQFQTRPLISKHNRSMNIFQWHINLFRRPGKPPGLTKQFLLARAISSCIVLASVLLMGCNTGSADATTPPEQPPEPPPVISEVTKPTGAYTASGAQADGVLSHPLVKGALIRATWDNVETAPGIYDYTDLRLSVNAAKNAGKKWTLAVLAGPTTPNWIYNEPYNVPRINYIFRDQESVMAPAWHATVRERLRLLAQSLALEFGSDPDLELVYVTQMTYNGIEGQLPSDSLLRPPGTTWESIGWSADTWVDAITGTAADFADAFSDKALAIELHYVLGDSSIPQQIADNLCGDVTLQGRVGIAIWWLSGNTTYQPELINYLSNSSCDKYAQVIAPSSNTNVFPAVQGYGAIFTQAKALNIRYLEVWEQEYTSFCCQWDDEIADFNAWAAATF